MYGGGERCNRVVLNRTSTVRTRGFRLLAICCFAVPALGCASPEALRRDAVLGNGGRLLEVMMTRIQKYSDRWFFE